MAFNPEYSQVGATGMLGSDKTAISQQGTDRAAQNILISPTGLTEIPLPGQGFITSAIMTQEGPDLILEGADGVTVIIEDYFATENPPNLVAPDGKTLTPSLVHSFIKADSDHAEGPVTSLTDSSPVGEVQEVSGHATVTRIDGSSEPLAKGMPIHEGDIIETDAKGAVNIHFADDSSFAISNNAKLAIDEFIFDTQSNEGENKFSMLRGMFVYTSGLVGREDPDDVKINTPVGSIGIRGTIITGVLPEEGSGQAAKISVVEGAIVVNSVTGDEVILSQQFETISIDTSAGIAKNIGVLPQSEMAETFNVLRTVAPTLFSTIDEAGQEKPVSDSPAQPVQKDGAAVPEQQGPEPAKNVPSPQDSPQPDVIQLNLLPGSIKTPSLEHTAEKIIIETTADKTLSPLSITSIVSSPLNALPLSVTPPVFTAEPTLPVQPQTPPIITAPVNHSPVSQASFVMVEQPGANGASHSFDVTHLFRDSDRSDTLTYTVNSPMQNGTAAVGVTSSITTDGVLTFSALNSVTGNLSYTVNVTATDMQGASTTTAFSFTVYNVTGSYTEGPDAPTLSTASQRIWTKGGDDYITLNQSSIVVFAGAGDDEVTVNAGKSNNQVFGDEGDDIITLNNSGTSNTASGGIGNDTITVINNTAFKLFGGGGNDNFAIDANSLNNLVSGSSMIDGGAGFDTLSLGSGLSLNLSTSTLTSFRHLDKIQLSGTSTANSVTLKVSDVLQITGGDSIFIDTSNNLQTVHLVNDSGSSFIKQAGTVTDPLGTSYNIYSNGSVNVYVDAATPDANVMIA